MNILILGGTVFVGRGVAEAALRRNHQVTLFHRGSKGTGIVAEAEDLLGDRDGGLEALAGRKWDAVVDACGYVPRIVGDSAEALLNSAGRYLFVSTISVYEDDGLGGLRERPVPEPVGTEEITGETYGPLKVECEREVTRRWGERSTMVRPGLVYGPYDPTGRFPYWVNRFLEGSEVLVPDALSSPLQQIDARDLGDLIVNILEQDLGGVFDVVGEHSTFGAMIDACQVLNSEAKPVVFAVEAIQGAGISLGRDLPFSTPLGSTPAIMQIEPTRALGTGLNRRSIEATTADTAAWLRDPATEKPKNGLSREREAAALLALRA